MRNESQPYVFALVLAITISCVAFVTTSARAQGNSDVTSAELENFDRFLDAHQQIRTELTRNPGLVNDERYLHDRPELREFLATHGGVREELRENPADFMRRENGRPGYYRDEDQPHMQAALEHLRQADQELQQASHDKGGHRTRALGLTKQAESEVQAGISYDDHHGGDRR